MPSKVKSQAEDLYEENINLKARINQLEQHVQV
jgi:hypothetical protein